MSTNAKAQPVRTGNFVGRVRTHTPSGPTDTRCRVIPFPARGRFRDVSGWRVKACQWIDGDPKHRAHEPEIYCGFAVKPGSSYCQDHHSRCYVAESGLRTEGALRSYAAGRESAVEFWGDRNERGALYHGPLQLLDVPIAIEAGLDIPESGAEIDS